MNHQHGKTGEQEALEHLVDKGMKLIHKNFRCRMGEIDLIMKDGKVLVFVEVKSRFSRRYGLPREAVHKSKQRVIHRVASWYLQHVDREKPLCRFDVVEVYLDQHPVRIEHLPNAFHSVW